MLGIKGLTVARELLEQATTRGTIDVYFERVPEPNADIIEVDV